MDFCRALLLSLGVVFHAAALCEGRGSAFGVISSFIHSFRMEGFFLIAGFFSAMTLQKRSVDEYVVQRIARLGVPLLFTGITGAWWIEIVKSSEGSFARAFEPGFWLHGYWLAHLWFLGTLLIYVAIVFAVHSIVPEIDGWLGRHRIGFGALMAGVAIAYFVAIHLCKIAPQVFGATRWLVTSPYEILEYLPFFAAGYYAFLHPDLFDTLVRRLKWNTASVMLFALALWIIPEVTAWRYVLQLLKPVYVLSMCGLILWLARRYFAGTRALVRSFADASYTIYLVHLPILVVLYRVLDVLPLSGAADFFILTVATSVISYAFHTRLVDRIDILAFLLNGRTRVRPRLGVALSRSR